MNILKYIFLILGILMITYTKTSYVKRVGSNREIPYTSKEKNTLYLGYGCLIIAFVLVLIFN